MNVTGIPAEVARRVHTHYCGPDCTDRNCEGQLGGVESRILRDVVRECLTTARPSIRPRKYRYRTSYGPYLAEEDR